MHSTGTHDQRTAGRPATNEHECLPVITACVWGWHEEREQL